MALQLLTNNLASIYPAQHAGLFAQAYAVYDSVESKVVSIDVSKAAGQAKEWVVEHPYQTGLYVAGGVVIAVPDLVVVPVLGAAGFTAKGVAGGSAAAAFQSATGPVGAHSVYATLRSAAAAGYGYGVPIVHGAVQGATSVGLGTLGLWNKWRNPEAAEDSSEVEGGEEKKAEMEDLKAKL